MIHLGRLSLSVDRWRVRGDDHSCAVGLFWTGGLAAYALILGFGWDAEQPWRPWPTLRTTPTPSGARGFCVAWCGVFVQVRRRAGGAA